MVFKTVDIDEAADVQALPSAPESVSVDGAVTREEWEQSLLCSNFYSYDKKGKYYFSTILKNQPRIRMMADKTHLYVSAKIEKDETLELMLSPNRETAPSSVRIKASEEKIEGASGASMKNTDKDGAEIKIPLADLGIKDSSSFFANVVVSKDKTASYWRGNSFSFKNPLVFVEIARK